MCNADAAAIKVNLRSPKLFHFIGDFSKRCKYILNCVIKKKGSGPHHFVSSFKKMCNPPSSNISIVTYKTIKWGKG